MTRVPRNTIEHFTHPQHRLILDDRQGEYLCDGCKTIGDGMRYRCNEGCNFDLHEYCATCPTTLYTFMHPKHPLTLVVQNAHQLINRYCDVCLDPVQGLYYSCNKGCEFDVHPLCTQLPAKLRHALDTRHDHLELRTSSYGWCAVCGGVCTSWRYGCVTCCLDIHIQCVLTPLAPPGAHIPCGPPLKSSSTEPGISGFDSSRSLWPPPQRYSLQPQQYYPPPPPNYPIQPPHYPPPPNYPIQPPHYPLPPQPYPQYYPPQTPPPQHYPHYHGYGYDGVGIPYHCPSPYNNNMCPSPYNNNMCNANHAQAAGVGPNGGLGKKMFAILGRITLGVISSAIFGVVF